MTQLADITSKSIRTALLEGLSVSHLADSACFDLLLQVLHGSRTECPECHQEIQSDRQRQSFRTGGRVCCKNCGRWFDRRTGTILAATTLSARQIILLAVLIGQGLTASEIAGRLDLNEGTVRDWRERLSITG